MIENRPFPTPLNEKPETVSRPATEEATETVSQKPPAWIPFAWGVGGVVLGVAGTMMAVQPMLKEARVVKVVSSKAPVVAMAPKPAPVVATQVVSGEWQMPPIPFAVPPLPGTLPGPYSPSATNPGFGQAGRGAIALNSIPSLPMPEMTGTLPRHWPTPPPGGFGMSPINGSALTVKPVVPVLPPTAKTSNTTPPAPQPGQPAHSYLKGLLARGVPKAPDALPLPPSQAASHATPVAGGVKLVTLNVQISDPQRGLTQITADAQRMGGQVQALTDFAKDAPKSEPQIVLIAIPEAAQRDYMDRLAALGAISDQDTWTGSAANRKAKLRESAIALVDSLKKLKEALLVTYPADADPVKQVDSQIAKASHSMEQLQPEKIADGMVVIKVNLVQN